CLDLCHLPFEPTEGVEKAAMRRGIDQGAFSVLTVNFNECVAELLENLHAHRLVVDEGAASPIRKLHAAEDQFIFGGNIIGCEQRSRRMVVCDIKYRSALALLDALPDQCLVPAPA